MINNINEKNIASNRATSVAFISKFAMQCFVKRRGPRINCAKLMGQPIQSIMIKRTKDKIIHFFLLQWVIRIASG